MGEETEPTEVSIALEGLEEGRNTEIVLEHHYPSNYSEQYATAAMISKTGPTELLALDFYRDRILAKSSTVLAKGQQINFRTVKSQPTITRTVVGTITGEPQFFVRLYEALKNHLERNGLLPEDDG